VVEANMVFIAAIPVPSATCVATQKSRFASNQTQVLTNPSAKIVTTSNATGICVLFQASLKPKSATPVN
jgi:hypothetical protein